MLNPPLQLGPHSGSVPCLAVAIDGSFQVHVDGSAGPPVRSALIRLACDTSWSPTPT